MNETAQEASWFKRNKVEVLTSLGMGGAFFLYALLAALDWYSLGGVTLTGLVVGMVLGTFFDAVPHIDGDGIGERLLNELTEDDD